MADTSSQAGSLREELTAHISVAFMSLIGIAIYSTSYSVTMAMGISTKAVPVLEMWIVYSHLACSLCCILLQVSVAGIFNVEGGIPRVGGAQVSVFLGMACAATCASADCLAGTTTSCSAYFPAAASASVSSVCCILWAWIMYLTALGTVFPVQSFSLGISGAGGMTASTVMAMLPPLVSSRLVATCGSTMCSSDCSLASVIVASTFAMILSHVGSSIDDQRVSRLLRLCGVGVACLNAGVLLPGPLATSGYRIACSVLALFTCIPTRPPATREATNESEGKIATTRTKMF